MSYSDFYSSLNKVFSLMVENKLREDMDDTLLEKLLSVIKAGILETDSMNVSTSGDKLGFIECLLEYTDPLPLFEKVFLSLKGKTVLSDTIEGFTLRLFGMIAGNEKVFDSLKNTQLSMELSTLFKSKSVHMFASSIQGATLCCFFSIAKHPTGVLWLLEQNTLGFPFSCFTCSSYYIRKQAVNSFADALSHWASSQSFNLLHIQRSMLNENIERIVAQLVQGADFFGGIDDTTVSNCCVLTLKQSIEMTHIKNLVCLRFNLIEQVSNYFKNLKKVNEIKSNVQDLLLTLYASDNDPHIEGIVKEAISHLISHQMFVPAIDLASSFLKVIGASRSLSIDDLHLLLMPLYVLSGDVSLDGGNEIFYLSSGAIYSSMMEEMDMKSCYINLISSSLSALSCLASCMDPMAIESALTLIDLTEDGALSQQNHAKTYMCLESRKICFSLLELFSSLLPDTVYSRLSLNSQTMLMQYMLSFLERPSTDCNVQCEILKHLKTVIALNARLRVALRNEVKDKLVLLLCRKVVDRKEAVVDSSLHLVTQLLSKQCNEDWKEPILSHNLVLIVWNLAINGTNEGFLQASALKGVTAACLSPFCWEIIRGPMQLTEVDVFNILCNFFHVPDFFVQRESLSCIFQFTKANDKLLCSVSPCKENLFTILLLAVNSLDLELKLTALKVWQWFLENSSCFSLSDIDTFVKDLCESGFGKSLLLAIEDYDDAVMFKANNILSICRNKIVSNGYSKDSITAGETLNEDAIMVESTVELSVVKFKFEERMAALDCVMELSTNECVADIYKRSVEQLKYSKHERIKVNLPRPCSVKSFWSCLWSEHLGSTSLNGNVSTVLSDQSVSLLDDIIAAEKTEMDICVNDVPDCY